MLGGSFVLLNSVVMKVESWGISGDVMRKG